MQALSHTPAKTTEMSIDTLLAPPHSVEEQKKRILWTDKHLSALAGALHLVSQGVSRCPNGGIEGCPDISVNALAFRTAHHRGNLLITPSKSVQYDCIRCL